jgi:hypothetical protein
MACRFVPNRPSFPTSAVSAAALAAFLGLAAAPAGAATVLGTILEDVDGDADLSDAVALEDVRVRLYADDGDGVPDSGDSNAGSLLTPAAGTFSFSGLANGTYWVTVQASTLDPSAGGTGIAEQTLGPAGARCDDGTGSVTTRSSEGPCYGGMQGNVADNATFSSPVDAEHVVRVVIAADADVTGLNIAFSFNVVTRTDGGTGQGTFRSFISNASNGTGPNAMRFVPAVPPNASATGAAWGRA